MKYQLATVTRLGNRKENEDSYASFFNGQVLLMVVADGMGGHQGGKIASNTAIKIIEDEFKNERGLISDPVVFLQNALLHAHQAINDAGAQHAPPIQPRTTVVMCLIQKEHAWWTHAGDSRLYLFRHNKLVFHTQDHSRMADLIKQGLITEKQALIHPERGQITRCLGGHKPITSFTISKKVPLELGDMMLLCTDGMWNPMQTRHIIKQLKGNRIDDIASNLASEAESKSMPRSDNITAILMRWMTIFGQSSMQSDTKVETSKDILEEAPQEESEVVNAVNTLQSIFDEYEKELKK